MLLFRQLVREPLVHFLVLGGLMFAYSHYNGSNEHGSKQIVLSRGLIQHQSASFSQSRQRAPTDIELKGLLDDYVKEEIATREATVLGLDRDDVIIRRRLRQKLEFLSVQQSDATPPSDAELVAWQNKHPDAFNSEPKLAFTQIYLSPQRRGTQLGNGAAKLLKQLQAEKAVPTAQRVANLGDSTMLPLHQELLPLRDVARSFGQDFADDLIKLPAGAWVGPVESSFGLHLVYITEKQAGVNPQLAEIKALVAREVQAERRSAALQELYDNYLKNYKVRVDSDIGASPSKTGSGAK